MLKNKGKKRNEVRGPVWMKFLGGGHFFETGRRQDPSKSVALWSAIGGRKDQECLLYQ